VVLNSTLFLFTAVYAALAIRSTWSHVHYSGATTRRYLRTNLLTSMLRMPTFLFGVNEDLLVR
jgi:hypothetical protein